MGKRGPAPKPTKWKRFAGNPGHRPLNRNEPRLPAGVPPAPECVLQDEIALAEWNRVVPELLRLGVLSELYAAAIAAYCMSFSRWQQAEEILRQEGRTYKLRNGTVCKHPAVDIARDAMVMMRVFAGEFGMSPAARSRLHVTMPDDQESKKVRRYFGNEAQ